MPTLNWCNQLIKGKVISIDETRVLSDGCRKLLENLYEERRLHI